MRQITHTELFEQRAAGTGFSGSIDYVPGTNGRMVVSVNRGLFLFGEGERGAEYDALEAEQDRETDEFLAELRK